ncbi:MAG: glycosyltransferase family 39 protein, partial [Pirellulales bacterium]
MSKLLWVFSRLRSSMHTCGHSRYLLGALLLLGSAARVRQYLAQSSYWHDEAYLLLNVFPKSFFELVGPLSHEQAAPPLFLWLLRASYLALGPSELAMRLPALLASLATLGFMAPLARLTVGGRSWLWAVACAAVSSSLLYLTCQVKPYTTDVLVAEAVLLATVGCLMPGLSNGWRRASHVGLLLA